MGMVKLPGSFAGPRSATLTNVRTVRQFCRSVSVPVSVRRLVKQSVTSSRVQLVTRGYDLKGADAVKGFGGLGVRSVRRVCQVTE